jgi:hypothetical protein
MLAALTTLVFVASPAASSYPELAPPSMTMTSIDRAADPEVEIEKGYGTSILAVDGLGIGMLLLASATESEAVAWAGVATMAFGPGLVHAAKGRSGEALASMVLRPGAVVVGAKLGYELENCDESGDEWCGLGGIFLGGIVGYGAAVVLDAGVLAREKKIVREHNLAPQFAASSQGMRVGLGGTF